MKNNSFQGQEKDNEIKGIGNSVNYKFRMHDPRIGRFFAVDPLAKKYPWNSSYAFATNNPVHLVDVDGMGVEENEDLVFFDKNGKEVLRYKSKTINMVIIMPSNNCWDTRKNEYSVAPLPSQTIGEDGKKQEYTNLDYQIAASTFLFNEKIKAGKISATAYHQFTNNSKIPIFSPNLVKAMAIQESSMGTNAGASGTGKTDVLQANVPRDYKNSKDVKKAVGLEKNQEMTPNTSIQAGLGILLIKGMNYDSNGNATTWKGLEKL